MSIEDKLTQVAENVPKVYAAGQKAEYDAFWNLYQSNGTRKDYTNAFGGIGWTNETFKPKHNINPSGGSYMMFRSCGVKGDLVAIAESLGIHIDFTQLIACQYMFQSSNFTRIGNVKTVSGTYSLTSTFDSCKSLETIDSLYIYPSQALSAVFSGCTALKNLTIDGSIGKNGFNVSACPLTHDSLMSIINALENKTSGTFSVTLGATNLAKLTDAEKAIATQKGWTLA